MPLDLIWQKSIKNPAIDLKEVAKELERIAGKERALHLTQKRDNMEELLFEVEHLHADDNINLDEWVEKTEGLTIDHLKDLIISVLVLNIPLDDAINKLKVLNKETVNIDSIDIDAEMKDVAISPPMSGTTKSNGSW